jgi:hypothetical protein
MSDTAPRNPVGAPRMLADALLRSVAGTTALLRLTAANAEANQSELGLVSTTFLDLAVSPVVMRRQRPSWKEGGASQWELLVSATSIQQQLSAVDATSAEGLFAMTLAVTVAGQDYLIEGVAANEAFGQVYLYRLLLREAGPSSI